MNCNDKEPDEPRYAKVFFASTENPQDFVRVGPCSTHDEAITQAKARLHLMVYDASTMRVIWGRPAWDIRNVLDH